MFVHRRGHDAYTKAMVGGLGPDMCAEDGVLILGLGSDDPTPIMRAELEES